MTENAPSVCSCQRSHESRRSSVSVETCSGTPGARFRRETSLRAMKRDQRRSSAAIASASAPTTSISTFPVWRNRQVAPMARHSQAGRASTAVSLMANYLPSESPRRILHMRDLS